jgi:class 3 adenylate cyclase/tetratricopeptide (TPR) repeat protein
MRWLADDLAMKAMEGGCDLAKASDFRLGGLAIRPPTREVIATGETLLLEPRIMQVLVILAQRRGEVVSRGELIDSCWGGRAVGDDAINRCIQAIRRLAAKQGGFAIRTVARVGYRLEEADQEGDGEPATLPALATAQPGPTAVHVPPASERRHLTILSCGLLRPAGAGLDPETNYAVAASWRQMVAEAALRFGGHVDGARGDRMLLFFGYPEAQEDAGERAVRAGLAIVEQMGPLNMRLQVEHGISLAVKIGVHAGMSVVAGGGEAGVELFGEAIDLAARIEALAGADEVTISAAILDAVSGRFVTEPHGEIEHGCVGQCVALHRVHSAGLAGERRKPRGGSAFIGREEELALLASRWARARNGAGQLVLVHGEPGIGKSRLVASFKERIAADPHLWIECRGEQLFANTVLYASSQMLWRGLGWRGDESPRERSAALEQTLQRSGLKLAEAVPLVCEMLDLPIPAHYPPLMLAPEQRRRRLLATLADWLFSATRNQPLVLVVEDLHWLDPSSLELLHTLAEQGAGLPLLLLCTARPEFHPQWPARSHHIQIALGKLGPDEMRALVSGLEGEEALDAGAVEAIVDRADGIPLFAEALARLVGGQADTAEIPATLMDSLAARLDRLGEARGIAQIGAVIGREFSWESLRAASAEPDDALLAALARLIDAGLVDARGTPPDSRYRFNHGLIRDAAYGLLLTGQRRAWHRRVAEAIGKGIATAEPEELAHHWTQAGEADQAISAWTKAGAIAYSRHAFAEAAAAYRQALAILATQPETPARDARELELSVAISLVLMPTKGAQSDELVAIVSRNQALSQRSGNLGELVTARTYAFVAASFGSDWAQAARLADQVAELAEHAGEDAQPEGVALGRAMGHYCRFTTAFYCGDLEAAETQFRGWEAMNREAQYSQRAAIMMSYGNGAILAWLRGDAAEARRRIASAEAFVRERDSVFDRGVLALVGALLRIYQRDAVGTELAATQALAIAREHGFAQVEGWAGIALGWARAQQGFAGEGVAQIRANLLQLARVGTRLSLPWLITMLGEAQALDGDIADAMESFEEALTVSPAERQYRPYTLICRAELSAQVGDTAQAEKDFREAIALSETMGALSCKLRAMTGLARLHGGKEMRVRLAAMTDRIIGGGDCRDVIEARALIRGRPV